MNSVPSRTSGFACQMHFFVVDTIQAIDSRSVEQYGAVKISLDVSYCRVFFWDNRRSMFCFIASIFPGGMPKQTHCTSNLDDLLVISFRVMSACMGRIHSSATVTELTSSREDKGKLTKGKL